MAKEETGRLPKMIVSVGAVSQRYTRLTTSLSLAADCEGTIFGWHSGPTSERGFGSSKGYILRHKVDNEG